MYLHVLIAINHILLNINLLFIIQLPLFVLYSSVQAHLESFQDLYKLPKTQCLHKV